MPDRLFQPDKVLDARRLACPLPILKATKAIKAMSPGDVLEVLATDPGAVADFEALCAKGRHALIEKSEAEGVWRFVIRRGVD